MLDRELRERFEHIGKVTPGLLLRWCPQPSGMVPVRVLKLASCLSVLAVERVPQDREQPRMEVRVWLEPIEVGPGSQDGLLHEIVCLIHAVGEREGKGPQAGNAASMASRTPQGWPS